jgi:hypothetical protein
MAPFMGKEEEEGSSNILAEQWELGSQPEEELYVRGNTVVWSCGGCVR